MGETALGEIGLPPDAPSFNRSMAAGGSWKPRASTPCAPSPDRVVFHDQTTPNAVLWNRWTPPERPWSCFSEHTVGRFSVYPFGQMRKTNLRYVFAKPWQQRHS